MCLLCTLLLPVLGVVGPLIALHLHRVLLRRLACCSSVGFLPSSNARTAHTASSTRQAASCHRLQRRDGKAPAGEEKKAHGRAGGAV